MENKGPETKKFCITIEEKYVRGVIIEAGSQEEAEEICENLCAEGIIDLSYDNFSERYLTDVYKPSDFDLSVYDTYTKNGKVGEL